MTASGPRGRSGLRRRHQPVEDLPFANHPELLPRRALLRGRVRLERAGESVERVERDLEVAHRLALLRELAVQLEPVDGAVLPRLKPEYRQHGRPAEAGAAWAGRKPYRSRPG